MEENYKVYIKIDESSNITAIDSEWNIPDTTGWLYIDEGQGDKYHHAQGNYLDNPLIDEQGIYNYKYADGEVAERTVEDKAVDMAVITNNARKAEIYAQLDEIDRQSARPLRAVANGIATEYDTDKLAELETSAQALRAELATL